MYYKTTIYFERKNFNTTSAAKFKGKILFWSNEYGIIVRWEYLFTCIDLDTLTTKSAFIDKRKWFKSREELFNLLEINEQKIRDNRNDHKFIKLSIEQIGIFNNYINNKYNSTLKNIIGIIKGSNPNGEIEKPENAEMILSKEEELIGLNFVVIFDDLKLKTKLNDEDEKELKNYCSDLSLKEYLNKNKYVKQLFDKLQSNNDFKDKESYFTRIREYTKQYSNVHSDVDKWVEKERGKFRKNVTNMIDKNPGMIAFLREEVSKTTFDKAHIFPVFIYKKEIIKIKLKNNFKQNMKDQDIDEILGKISDNNNFLPLSPTIHKLFDNPIHTPDISFCHKTGKCIFAKSDKIKDKDKTEIENHYKEINHNFLTKERASYLKNRNDHFKNFK